MSNWSFVTLAYALTWGVFAAYFVLLSRRVSVARAAFESGLPAADGGA